MEIVEITRRSDDWGVLVLDVDVTNQRGESVVVETHRLLVATSENDGGQ